MRTIKLVISYDGTGYCGWQRQQNRPTIQQEVERAVSIICAADTVVHGAGRTDAGVHALGMAAHFHATSRVPLQRLQSGLNSLLPGSIRIVEAREERPDFHARFSAIGKTYRYRVYTGAVQAPEQRQYALHYPYTLDPEAMLACLEAITGTLDFSSFENSGSRDPNRKDGRGAIRTIYRTELRQPRPEHFLFMISGDGFLRQMVRNLCGTILEVGRGQKSPVRFEEILASRDRQQAGATAAAHGLTLMEVHYRSTGTETSGPVAPA